MAIEKKKFKASRFNSEFPSRSREIMSSDEDDLQRRCAAVESHEDADSGAGSDDFDLLDLEETGAEFCQIGNQTCSIPLELYDLLELEGILSVDVWNEVLSEEERLGLAKFLPDMDYETFVVTLKELFTGSNFHFGSPIKKLFDMLKAGLCAPRVAVYREGLSFFQKRQHYHLLRKHQNEMVGNLCQIRDAWLNCRGCSIEEKLHILNIMRSHKNFMFEKMDNLGSDSSEENSDEALWSRKGKDKKAAQKTVPHSTLRQENEFYWREQSAVLKPDNYGKQNPKGMTLAGSKQHSAKDMTRHLSSSYRGLDVNSLPNDLVPFVPQSNKARVFCTGVSLMSRDQIKMTKDTEEPTYDMGFQRDRDVSDGNPMDTHGGLRTGKKHGQLRLDKIAPECFLGVPQMSKADLHAAARESNKDLKHMSKPSGRTSYDFSKEGKYPGSVPKYVNQDKVKPLKSRGSHFRMKGSMIDSSSYVEPFWQNKSQGDYLSSDLIFRSDQWTLKSKRSKQARKSPDICDKNYRSSSPQVTEKYLHSDFRSNFSQEMSRGAFMRNGRADMVTLKGNHVLYRSEDTGTDSSDHFDGDEDNNPLLRSKFAYPHRIKRGTYHSISKSCPGPKKLKSMKREMKAFDSPDGVLSTKKMDEFEGQDHLAGFGNYVSNAKQKGKVQTDGSLHNPTHALEDGYLLDKPIFKFRKNGRIQGEPIDLLYMSSSKSYNNEGKRKNRTGNDHTNFRSHHLGNYVGEEEDDLRAPRLVVEGVGVVQGNFGKKGNKYESSMNNRPERYEASLLGCNSVSKRRKRKEDVMFMDAREEDANLQSNFSAKFDDSSSLKRKAKKKQEPDAVSLEREESELPTTEIRKADINLDVKPQKKSFAFITPTVHTGFSFSVIHLLSAVRLAMIMPLPSDASNIGIPKDNEGKERQGGVSGVHSDEKVDSDGHTMQDIPFLTIPEIVNHVRSNPGDPSICETQEPLQDLVRGVMKIFSSKSAPLGAKGWKALAIYEKSTKSWSWVGPIVHNYSDHATFEEVTSPEAWGLPHKMLVKLVDAFANWLKSGQDTLQQIGSLPEPPLGLMQINLDEKERFKDLRAQKSLNTISPSLEEVRDYFRMEEILRYSIPDRAFSYTAVDGKKSIVAPLRRCGGKPTSKARDHFMLKRDRPPHVTILCLVRDAAARLPGSIGTRADVCTLIRDSQYIVEDVSDTQINQVVSGALDRLHYERDPCVQYDGERKLWVYLHRDREEEDFEDDGTSSTKKWKRPKRDGADHSDQGPVAVPYHGTRKHGPHDVCSALNVEPSFMEDDNNAIDPVTNDVRLNTEDSIDGIHESEEVDVHQGSMSWDSFGLQTIQKDKSACQENSTNEDFNDE